MADCEKNVSCENCPQAAGCKDKDEKLQAERAKRNISGVKHMFGVVSGKGGVGKSLVTALLAQQVQRLGFQTAVLDADITGPSIPKIFGIHGLAETKEDSLLPKVAPNGTKIMSLNLLLEHETDPVFWRGPVISGVVRQFWEETAWGAVDYMFVDMPPGTGDVPLTVFQSLPIQGVFVVATPQSLVSMIVQKAVSMAARMDVPVLGLIENMRTLICPHCGKEIPLFGSDEAIDAGELPVLERLPLDPEVAAACDAGTLAERNVPYLERTARALVGAQKADV